MNFLFGFYLLLLAIFINQGVAAQLNGKLSDCLEKCLIPMAKIEKTISYIYLNYENVCETLEKSAKCSQKCNPHDQTNFFQYTTFYRIHCIELEEALEEHMDCLKSASYKADVECRSVCGKKSNKNLSKEEKQKNVCKTVECSSICYFKEFVQTCPKAKNVLMQINIRNADEMKRLTHPKTNEDMFIECKRIHDSNYMKNRLLESISNKKKQ